MTGFKLWCIVSSGITHGDVMRSGDTVGSQWNTWSTSCWFVWDQDLNLDLHYEDRQVYLSWAANRGRRRYDHANLTGWAFQIMFVDVPSLNVILLGKKTGFCDNLHWKCGVWSRNVWDLTSGFLQILLGMSGDLSISSFHTCVRHTRPYLRKDMVICWGNCAVWWYQTARAFWSFRLIWNWEGSCCITTYA